MPKKNSAAGRKSVKIRKALPKVSKPVYESDDDIPDEGAEDYHKDDIDKYNDQVESESSDDYGDLEETTPWTKDPVYEFSDSDGDDSEMENRLRKLERKIQRKYKHTSDSEEGENGDELGLVQAWGKRKADFYGTDVKSKVNLGYSSDDDHADARLEEQEARTVQQEQINQIDDADFGVEMFSVPTSSVAESLKEDREDNFAKSKVVTDISNISDAEKTRLLKAEYPEFMNIVADFKAQLGDFSTKLQPIRKLHQQELLSNSSGIKFVEMKSKLILDYCLCAQFYLLLRAERLSVDGHPVIKRMLQLKHMIKELNEVEEKVATEINYCLKKVCDGKQEEIVSLPEHSDCDAGDESYKANQIPHPVEIAKPHAYENRAVKKISRSERKEKKKIQDLLSEDDSSSEGADFEVMEDDDNGLEDAQNRDTVETAGEAEAIEFYNMMKKNRLTKDLVSGEYDAEESSTKDTAIFDEDEKRAITEEMQKNRGLTAKRPKALKNPRVKNKVKFQKKKKIYKTIVPQVMRETSKYSGEASGIRAGRIRSVQLS